MAKAFLNEAVTEHTRPPKISLLVTHFAINPCRKHNLYTAASYSLCKYFEGENFHGFRGFLNNLEILTLKILSCIKILYSTIFLQSAKYLSQKSSKPLIRKHFNSQIFRLHGSYVHFVYIVTINVQSNMEMHGSHAHTSEEAFDSFLISLCNFFSIA